MTNRSGGNSNLGSLSVSEQDKGTKNKRKLVDPSPDNPINQSSCLTEFPRFEPSSDKSRNPQSELGGLEVGSTQPTDWDGDPVELQLQELLMTNIHTIFQNAIKQLVESGYNEDIAQKAISRLGLYYGDKDLVANIVNDAVTLLKDGKENNGIRDVVFDNLQQMVEYTMLEMVNVLREVKPSLSTGEAMWWLLICDLNISQACALGGDLLSEFSVKEIPGESSSDSTLSKSSSKSKSSEPFPSNNKEPNISNSSLFDAQSYSQGTVKFGSFPNLPDLKSSFGLDGLKPEKESFLSVSGSSEKSLSTTTSHISVSEGKLKTGRKTLTKKELAIWQKTLNTERALRNHGKSISQSGKITSFGGFISEKRMKSPSESHGLRTKGSVSNAKAKVEMKGSRHVITSTPPVVSASVDSLKEGIKNASAAANTELTVLGKKPVLKPEENTILFPKISDYYAGIPYDKSVGKYVAQDEKDEFILRIAPRVQELQNDIQNWTQWANQKVMQAARRLSKDKPELKALKLEKEEAEQFKKDKKVIEENAMKRLAEVEYALINTTGQVETSNSNIQKLEEEHSLLKQALEAAKLQAAESAVSCQEALEREQKALKDAQSWNGQKSLLLEELETHKQKVLTLQRNIDKAEKIQNQFEARWKQERLIKEKWLAQAASIKHEWEQLEAAKKLEEDMIRQNAENDVKNCVEDIKRLEKEISDLKLKSDASRIAALKRGIDGNYGLSGNWAANVNMKGNQDSNNLENIVHFQETFGTRGLRWERECVMCLSEEKSVVFIPCAHQVLCTKCNELHKEEGMKDCPSCRTPIMRRIPARFANP
ncbi:hypothetical protein JCGZ_21992 [Jatropha curcas]|uniref:RING-type domain-containing protein n=1 Tax=Jatropha curcas TaxID=180498 RepID=A0A067JCF1_JATCU|nr:putative E3 ubiquitin-protein ligase RF298 [Jatropha curcas]XP_012092316.1 putative E3 ubiquitin-protein ligase RF298 [Jatropha curcas]KDP21521.1 hypothetical protein JCGZ_21992 [Jatropha curcas]